MSIEASTASSSSSISANSLAVPADSQDASTQGIVRRLSQIASNFAITPVECQLSDDEIKELGEKLLKDYIRDRLYRNGIIADDYAFIEENNNAVNGIGSPSNEGGNPNQDPHFLSVSQLPVSRSDSLSGSQRSNSPSVRSRTHPLSPASPASPASADGTLSPCGSAASGLQRSRSSVSSASTPAPHPFDAIAVVLRRSCLYLEKKHTSIYREVSRPLGITMSSLDHIRQAMHYIGKEVLKDVGLISSENPIPKSGPMWARIVSLYVVTSAFCLDCTVQGHTEHIGDVIAMSLDMIFSKDVCSNIRTVGGWSNLVENSKNNKKENELMPLAIVVVMGAILGIAQTCMSYLFTSQVS